MPAFRIFLAGLGSAILALVVALVLAGISASGVITMQMTHVFFWLAFAVGVAGVTIATLVAWESIKYSLIALTLITVVLGLALLRLDSWLNREKTRQEGSNKPPPTINAVAPAPVVPIVKTPIRRKTRLQVEQHGNGNGAVNGDITLGPCAVNQVGGIGNTANPNCTFGSPSVRYEVNGVRHREISPGHTSVDDEKNAVFNSMTTHMSTGDWEKVRALADAQIKDAPEWLTPYYYAAKSHINLCDKQMALADFGLFLAKAKSRNDYQHSVTDAKAMISKMKSGEMPPQCSKQP
jgi:hypothetical protein